MKRAPALRPLSREHHFALAEARAIRWALAGREGSPREARASFLSAWTNLIAEHFAAEERWILPLVPLREDAERLRAEHEQLRALVERLSIDGAEAEPDLALLSRLAQALEEHIRWEERHLFPAIEKEAPPENLRAAGEKLAGRE
ncbi:MAG: hemerythrin domain-containing protein [Planctomycetota bacterium]